MLNDVSTAARMKDQKMAWSHLTEMWVFWNREGSFRTPANLLVWSRDY